MAQKILIGLLTTLIAGALVAIGFMGRMVVEPAAGAPGASTAASNEGFSVLEEIAKVLGEDFVEPERADPELLRDGAIQGMFGVLDDPHSQYITPNDYALTKSDFEGAFEGIGATVSKQDQWLVIVQPLPDTPAERAGVKAGDTILSVDGESAEGWTVEQGVLRIRGVAGTTVELGLRHLDGQEETLSVERASITQVSVTTTPPGGRVMDADGNEVTDYAYIHIRSFTRTTPDELQKALDAAKESNARGIILDVRSNPGGLLSETVEIVDMFLDSGKIVTQVDRAGNEEVATARSGMVTDLPLVVLQDQFSASGSELLAAAIKDNGRGTVIGTRSFGKGTVNHVRELSDGGAVYVTIARWLTPAGNQIEGNGVQPDVLVAPTQEDILAQRDIWMHRAIDTLRSAAS